MSNATQSVPVPPKLRLGDKANYETLKKACNNGDLALVSAIRKSDGKAVALLCAMGWENETYYPAPLAVMVEGNPFELFHPPVLPEEVNEP